jgi:hypothetical protein
MSTLTPEQVAVHTVTDFLLNLTGPLTITQATHQALRELLLWHITLDSDEPEDNRLIANLAKAFDVANTPATADPETTRQLTAIAQQLDMLFRVAAQCATCAAEMRQGARPAANVVNVIVDGTGYCHEHVDLVGGRLVPKTSSGLYVPPGRVG